MKEPDSGRQRFRLGLRPRILAWYVILVALTAIVSFLVARQLLIGQLDQRIREQLNQEVEELRVLADNGIDPSTGEPFGTDIHRLFEVFLERSIPSRNEALMTFVDGEPFLRSRPVTSYRLDEDAEFVAAWSDATEPEIGRVSTPEGDVDYQAVPIRLDAEAVGTFVIAVFRLPEVAALNEAVRTAELAGLITVVVGLLLAWQVAEQILRRVRRMTATAREIGESDLSRRLEVEQRDELGGLAQQLNDMLDRLESAFSSQRQFVDDAGHELRTPLTAIQGHLEVMGDDPDDRRETIPLVLDELDRMTRIVNDLLLLARSERPDFLDPGLVVVGQLVTDVSAKAAGLADRNWQLASVPPELTIVADGQRLTQAMLQLAQNATQHTSVGDTITLGAELADGMAELWVADTGEGIPLADQALIFERFHRARGGIRRSEGAGLGLSIVHAIADAHGGSVRVSSEPGHGATFTIGVPASEQGKVSA